MTLEDEKVIYNETNSAMYKAFAQKSVPDGAICFFATDPTCLGKGIGTQLLEELSRHAKGKLIYLYTDDDC